MMGDVPPSPISTVHSIHSPIALSGVRNSGSPEPGAKESDDDIKDYNMNHSLPAGTSLESNDNLGVVFPPRCTNDLFELMVKSERCVLLVLLYFSFDMFPYFNTRVMLNVFYFRWSHTAEDLFLNTAGGIHGLSNMGNTCFMVYCAYINIPMITLLYSFSSCIFYTTSECQFTSLIPC